MDDAVRVLLGFCAALRAAGVRVTQDRAAAFLRAATVLGAHRAIGVYRAGRATLCGGPEDLERFDQVFGRWFGPPPVSMPRPLPSARPTSVTLLPDDDRQEPTEPSEADVVATLADDRETLRRRDIAELDDAERALLAERIAALRPRPPLRRAARTTPWRRGRPDLRGTLRASLRRAGEPTRIERRGRTRIPRRVVFLVDVSGSMRPYAEALLRLAHAVVRGPAGPGPSAPSRAEAFTLGTRLTRVTEALRGADPERALASAGALVPDWSGGTRLADTLATLLDDHGGRLRGAVVVICSDGWERGDPADLAERVARLRRLARSLIWINPHRGKDGYRPVQSGVAAVLPHLDHFLAGHTMATFEDALEIIAAA